MMIKFNSCLLALMCFCFSAIAQNLDDKKILFTIDEKPFYADQFERVYKKNINLVLDDEQKNIDKYLDLYVFYKLKVLKAEKEGLDKKDSFINEFNTNRRELIKNFNRESEVTKELLDEAYERYLTEVRASHILFLLPENASSKDTLNTYNAALDARNRILKGEKFETVAKQVSQDPSVAQNGGDLKYFSVFKMVYPVETAAYNTNVGEVTMPIRSRFGYHIIKVTDKQPNRGKTSVRAIMLSEDIDNPDASAKKAEDIYNKLLAGESFEELAKNHSDDLSANKGGLLPDFSPGDLVDQVLEDKIFELKNPKDFTKPIKSLLGWLIFKLENKVPLQSFEELKENFTTRILNDERSQKISNKILENAHKTYSYKINEVNLKTLIKAINVKTYNKDWKLNDANTLGAKPILTINDDKKLSVNDFVNFMTSITTSDTNIKPISKFVNNTFTTFADSELVAYYFDNLEKTDVAFGDLVTEFHDGLLIFSIFEQDILDKAKSDTIGLKNYFDKNIEKYKVPKRYNTTVFSTTDKAQANKIAKMVKQEKDEVAIKSKLNKANNTILVRSQVLDASSNLLPTGIDETKKVNGPIKQDNYYYIVKINEVLPESQLDFNQAKQQVINDYQQELESTWYNRLKQEFKVQIKQSVFNDVKASL